MKSKALHYNMVGLQDQILHLCSSFVGVLQFFYFSSFVANSLKTAVAQAM